MRLKFLLCWISIVYTDISLCKSIKGNRSSILICSRVYFHLLNLRKVRKDKVDLVYINLLTSFSSSIEPSTISVYATLSKGSVFGMLVDGDEGLRLILLEFKLTLR